ncbi:hypothetical protein IWZ01DRAFT_480065 [Phyllosticta capitalensis]
MSFCLLAVSPGTGSPPCGPCFGRERDSAEREAMGGEKLPFTARFVEDVCGDVVSGKHMDKIFKGCNSTDVLPLNWRHESVGIPLSRETGKLHGIRLAWLCDSGWDEEAGPAQISRPSL